MGEKAPIQAYRIGSRPRKRLLAIERSGARDESWWMVSMPRSMASRALRIDAGQGFDQCRLSRSIISQQGNYFAGIDFEIDILQRLYIAERLVDAFEADKFGSHMINAV